MTAEQPTIASTWIEQATYEFLESGTPRFLFHQGSSRSSKTYNICIAFAQFLAETPGQLLSIVRATGPALKATVQRDMIEVLGTLGLYDTGLHNKTEGVITLARSGSQIEFFSVDEAQKVKGRKRGYLWPNEANELGKDDFRQLRIRTEKQIVLDFNPSAPDDHWIWGYEKDPRAIWYYSTYRDNPFLPEEQVREIEALQDEDEVAWQIYGLGKRAVSKATIYPHVERLSEYPDVPHVYAIDWGYNDPMVLLRVGRRDANPPSRPRAELLVWSLVHESHLTTDDLIARMPELGVRKRYDVIYCDGAEPDRIVMLQRAGYNAKAADKSKGSRKAGIDFCKTHTIRIGGPASERSYAEIKGYRWKQAPDERILDEPIELNDHAPDALRYGAYSHWGGIMNQRTRGGASITI